MWAVRSQCTEPLIRKRQCLQASNGGICNVSDIYDDGRIIRYLLLSSVGLFVSSAQGPLRDENGR